MSDTRVPSVRRQVVVLVDDDPPVLSALRRLFREESFDLLSTSDPLEALEWIRTRDVGALLADDHMPVMSGTSLFHLAKVHSPSTARIMLTGYAGERIILHARTEGLFAVFAKPWDDRELKRVIRERLRERELEGMLPELPRS
jgi:DNA-binding NtrC family response regulator